MATQRDWYKAAALALRDRIVHRWLITRQAELRRRPQAGLLPQPRIPDRPAVHRRPEQYGAAAGVRDRAQRSRRRAFATCANANRMRRSAMAASDGWRRVSWRAWRRWRSPPSATASVTISACSARSSPTAGSRNIRTNGSASATPGNSSGRKWSITSISAAASSMSRTRDASARSGIRRRPCRPSPTTPRSSAGAASTSTRCGCGRRARPIRSSSTSSTPAIISAPAPRKPALNRSASSCIRTTRARRAANCGCARNISSSRPRCRIWSSVTSFPTGNCADWRRRPPCSSTTPIRASPSPS